MKLFGEPALIRPDVLWSVVRYLNRVGGTAHFDTVKNLLMGHARDVVRDEQQNKDLSAIVKALQALKLIAAATKGPGSSTLTLLEGCPTSLAGFVDHLHHHVAVDPMDGDIIQAYATLAALLDSAAERHALGEYAAKTAKADSMAALIRDHVGPDHVFNDTRMAAFQHWAAVLGLGVAGSTSAFYPVPAERLSRVLRSSGDFRSGELHEARLLQTLVHREMPYLDGSERYEGARIRIREKGSGQSVRGGAVAVPQWNGKFGYTLSAAIRYLVDTGELVLVSHGDDRTAVELSDGRTPSQFSAIRFNAKGFEPQ